MKRMIFVVASLLAGSAFGQITYVSGVQTNTGHVALYQTGNTWEDSYIEGAPDTRASWFPPSHDLLEQVPNVGTARLTTSWAATLAPARLAYHAATTNAITTAFGTGGAQFDYHKALDITFHLDSPQTVRISAGVERDNIGGWPSSTPCSMSFGPVGGTPIFALSYPGQQPSFSGQVPSTLVQLEPGDYRLLAQNDNLWTAGLHGANSVRDDFRFELVVLPWCGAADFNHDGDAGTDADIEAFFACIAGDCCTACDPADVNGDGALGTDADIDAFFRVLAGGSC